MAIVAAIVAATISRHGHLVLPPLPTGFQRYLNAVETVLQSHNSHQSARDVKGFVHKFLYDLPYTFSCISVKTHVIYNKMAGHVCRYPVAMAARHKPIKGADGMNHNRIIKRLVHR